jgi:hypothetical protein
MGNPNLNLLGNMAVQQNDRAFSTNAAKSQVTTDGNRMLWNRAYSVDIRAFYGKMGWKRLELGCSTLFDAPDFAPTEGFSWPTWMSTAETAATCFRSPKK